MSTVSHIKAKQARKMAVNKPLIKQRYCKSSMRTSNTAAFLKRSNSNLKDSNTSQIVIGPYQTSLLNYRHILKSVWSESSVKKTVEWTGRRLLSRLLWLDMQAHTVIWHALIIHNITSHQGPVRIRTLAKTKWHLVTIRGWGLQVKCRCSD